MKMFGECHAHIFLNGYDYRKAVETQKNGPRDTLIRAHFEEYRKRGIRFVRDGGDHYGVSKRAARLAPEYEIDYRTPVFAIYKEGHYGKIVGKSFSDMKEYHRRVLEAAADGHKTNIKISDTERTQKLRIGAVADLCVGDKRKHIVDPFLIGIDCHDLMPQLRELHGDMPPEAACSDQ